MLIVVGFQSMLVSCAAKTLAPIVTNAFVIAVISRFSGLIVPIFLESTRKCVCGWYASQMLPHGQLCLGDWVVALGIRGCLFWLVWLRVFWSFVVSTGVDAGVA